ncbi:sodium:solute symporter family protein [Cerasicoccus maritimus]|uniref:sodium:solute symporter family protein n=1 Tax=Cerasicoccus maritimus TaxID=490089 RepID=UPI002852D08C|nr:hypothetical protein [Cerasicoccus maritimus]
MDIEYVSLGAYMLALLCLGGVFAKYNRNLSDFVVSGAKGTWWLVGMSTLMSGISAFTFTGNASAAFLGGPSLLVIYASNCVAYLICGLFLAAWFRQTRARTVADVIRQRFGVAVEQFTVYSGVFLNPIAAAIQLWALAIFTSTVFGFPLTPTIVVIGMIVMFYSTTGGKWAVMATDFVQGVMMLAITSLVAFLSWRELGGIDGFREGLQDPQIKADFALFNPIGHFENNRFTIKWAVAIFFMQIYVQLSLSAAGRFIVAKDGREARRSAWFSFWLMALGSCIWFLPPMAARILYGQEIMGDGSGYGADSSYAFIAQRLLPNGLMGIMLAGMFAATMSSMDTGLNGQVGIVANNLIPRLRKLLGHTAPLSDQTEMRMCHLLSILFGLLIVGYSLLFSWQRDFPLFDAYLIIGSIIGIPLGLPMLMGLWFKRLPKWSYFVIFGFSVAPSIWSVLDERIWDNVWLIQDRALWIFLFGLLGTIVSLLFSRYVSSGEQQEIDAFFKLMKKPVDFEQEVGRSDIDYRQYVILSRFIAAIGVGALLLLLLPNSLAGHLAIFYISLFIFVVAGILHWGGVRYKRCDLSRSNEAPKKG